MSDVPPELIEAYRLTRYIVAAPEGAFTLTIGKPAPQLPGLYRAWNVHSAAFLTAWNPFGEQTQEAENNVRQAELEDRAKAISAHQIRSRGVALDDGWPPEDSTLILGISLADAEILGREFRQNALVWCGADSVPQLILLR